MNSWYETCNQLEVGLNLGRKIAYVQKAVKATNEIPFFIAKQRHAHHAPAGHAMNPCKEDAGKKKNDFTDFTQQRCDGHLCHSQHFRVSLPRVGLRIFFEKYVRQLNLGLAEGGCRVVQAANHWKKKQ